MIVFGSKTLPGTAKTTNFDCFWSQKLYQEKLKQQILIVFPQKHYQEQLKQVILMVFGSKTLPGTPKTTNFDRFWFKNLTRNN